MKVRGLLMRKYFACECDGCRGYRINFEDMRYQSARAVESVKGHYFSAGAIRFFGVKVSHFFPLQNSGAVFFQTMRGGFDDSPRVRAWVVYCPYGNLVDDLASEYREPVTAKGLRGFMRQLERGEFDQIAKLCKCHGCDIDRDGLRNIPDAEICISCPTHCAGD